MSCFGGARLFVPHLLIAKYYDIEKEAVRTDYDVQLTGIWKHVPNITTTFPQVNETMWLQ